MLNLPIPESLKQTAYLRVFGLLKVPLIALVSPRVVEVSDKRAEMIIPLVWRTKNHLGSMYFGALSIGADCGGGLLAMHWIQKVDAKISLVFKDFHAEFLKRPTDDVHFICEDGEAIQKCVEKAKQSGERESVPMHIIATCPKVFGGEPVAKFVLTLSVKKRAAN